MNIIDTTYRGIYSVSLNLNELSDRGINADKICITDGNDIILYATRGILIVMRDRLNELFPPESDEPESGLPEEPEGPGYYATQQNLLLEKDGDGDWSTFGEFSQWENDERYTDDWRVVYKTLGDEAFPLTKLHTKKEK
jgi:hypothetical protein